MWIRLFRSDKPHELTTTIVDTAATRSSSSRTTIQAECEGDNNIQETIPLDPFLYQYIVAAVDYVRDDDARQCGTWRFVPIPFSKNTVTATLVQVKILHKVSDAETFKAKQLNGCVVGRNTILQVEGCIILIQDIVSTDSNSDEYYRVCSTMTTIRLETEDTRSVECPGYESFLEELVRFMELPLLIRPSGIFVHGCGGVGKSTILECVMQRRSEIRYFQVPRTPFRFPSLVDNKAVYLVDDLDLIMNDNEQNGSAMEVSMNQGHMIVAFGAELPPPSFLSASRLEVVLELLPPSQAQREIMLSNLLPKANPSWIPNLAQLTAGCVAADLAQLKLVDGDDYHSYAEAAYSLIPSQMAALDVLKPALLTECTQTMTERELFIHSFREFVGYDEVKERLFRAVVLPWVRHLKGSAKGVVDPPAGVLFHGPSGCGKTIAAKCLGSSLGLSMIQVRASDVLDQFVGGSEAVVRAMFLRARQAAPCILFLDEIDSLASNREENSTGVMSRVLSTLLNEMDGISSGAGGQNVLIVACTNRFKAIDSALLRPGRLEIHIQLCLPSIADVEAVLRAKLRSVDLDADVKPILTRLANSGVSGADVYGVCREAVLQSLRRSRTTPLSITIEDLESALLRMGITP